MYVPYDERLKINHKTITFWNKSHGILIGHRLTNTRCFFTST